MMIIIFNSIHYRTRRLLSHLITKGSLSFLKGKYKIGMVADVVCMHGSLEFLFNYCPFFISSSSSSSSSSFDSRRLDLQQSRIAEEVVEKRQKIEKKQVKTLDRSPLCVFDG